MSTIPGPLIRFVIDQPGLSAAVTPAMQQLRAQAQATSAAIADDWKRMATQIRASLATEAASTKEITTSRQALASTLEKEIGLLRTKNELSVRELSNLKAMTLELERQQSYLKGTGGLTAGTQAFLSQAKNSILGNLVGGGILGSSAQAGFATLGTTGTILGVLTAAGVGLTAMATSGGKLAVELDNLSRKTGLTIDKVIALRSASEALDVNFDSVVTGFRKFSQQVTLALAADLPNATLEAKRAGEIFRILGVDVKKAAVDPMSAIEQLSKEFRALPDGAVKTSLGVQLFGRSAMELLPFLDKLPEAMSATSESSKALARSLGIDVTKSADAFKAQLVNFENEFNALEVSLAKHVLPALTGVVDLFNRIFERFSRPGDAYSKAVAEGRAANAGTEASSDAWPVDFGKYIADLGPTVKNTSKTVSELDAVMGTTGKTVDRLAETFKKFAEIAGRAHPGLTEQQKADQEILNRIGPSIGIQPQGPSHISGGVDLGALLTGKPTPFSPLYGYAIGAPPLSESQLAGLGPQPLNFSGINLGTPQSVVAAYNSLVADYVKETQSETEKIKAQYDEQLDYWRKVQEKYPDYAKEAKDAITKIQQEENDKLRALQQKQLEQYKHDADTLFEDLLEGKTKSFTKSLEKDLMNIVTEPVRKVFESLIGGIFSNLNTAINGGSSSSGSSSSSLTGWLGKVFGPASPGGTPGIFSGSLGLGSSSGRAGVAIQTGQTGVQTSTMYVSANVVNVGGSSSSGAPGSPGSNLLGLGSGFGTFFGNLNPFANAGFGGNLGLGFPSSGGTGGGGILSGPVGQILGGLLIGGLGAGSGSVTSEAMGAAAVASGLANIFGTGRSALGNPQSAWGIAAPQNLGQQLSGIFGGAGMFASGVAQGGVGGTLSSTAGGAEIGTMIAPGIGTAIGAAAGAIAGIISSIVGGPSWPQRVARAMKNQQYNLPPSETFNFAMGNSMSQTMSTGFSQTNDTFSSFNLPANTPFWANPIVGPLSKQQMELLQQEEAGLNPSSPFYGLNPSPFSGQGPLGFKAGPSPSVSVNFSLPGFVDAQSATAVFARYGQSLAQIVGSQLNQSSSGFARNIRSVMALP